MRILLLVNKVESKLSKKINTNLKQIFWSWKK